MRAHSLLLTAPRQLEWIAEDLPEPGPRDILIETRAGAISVGAELPQYRGDARSAEPAHYSHMTGYESVGNVIACGAAVERLRVGDRVFSFYGHRTHAIVPEAKAIAIPDGISDALALLAILSCDVCKGIRKVAPLPEEPALITGAGAIGLLTVAMLRAYGVRAVDVIEPRVGRRRLALRLGAQHTFAPEGMLPDNAYAVGFECSSRSAAFDQLQQSLRPDGRLCVLADGNIEPLTLTPLFHAKELMIVGSSDGWDYSQHAAWYFDLVRDDTRHLEELFEYETSAAALPETFARLAAGAITPVKVLTRYGRGIIPL